MAVKEVIEEEKIRPDVPSLPRPFHLVEEWDNLHTVRQKKEREKREKCEVYRTF